MEQSFPGEVGAGQSLPGAALKRGEEERQVSEKGVPVQTRVVGFFLGGGGWSERSKYIFYRKITSYLYDDGHEPGEGM